VQENEGVTGARAFLRAPLTRRAWSELGFSLAGALWALALIGGPAGLPLLIQPALGESSPVLPAVAPSLVISCAVALLVAPVLAPLVGRALGAGQRWLARRLLAELIEPPPPLSAVGGPVGRIGAAVGDGPGWRAAAYGLLKIPLGVLQLYASAYWLLGLLNLTYPFWWNLFRNHPPDVQLSPVAVITPLGTFAVSTYGGALLAGLIGVALLLTAPWVVRAVTAVDRVAMRGLLGPGRLAQRVEHLEQTRARAVDDAAAMLRKLERDLHDGAQIRLATLAMNLGQAIEDLGPDGAPPDVEKARRLVALAHQGAKEALVELRDLVRGLHPPVLDNGLGDALTTLTASTAIPTTLTVALPSRPTPAIETIAYFCTTELLANAAKHSGATRVDVDVRLVGERVWLIVRDDGVGGAMIIPGAGLAGLAQRVSTVDGELSVDSPAGGPTRVTVDLPRQP
jgi:signal transduction histidine kinase